MNHAKIAAALHALAEAFEGAIDEVVPSKGKGKGKASADPSPAVAATAPAASPASAPLATAPVVAAAAPAAPTVTKAQLNALVLKVAAKDRNVAEAILAKLGHKNTVTLPQELYQAAFDLFEEEVAKIDAAAVQVAQASLV
jgi:hypothetical protein